MRVTRFRLGAEELIELGNGKNAVNLDRRPFLSGRTKIVRLQLGQAEGAPAAGILDLLEQAAPYISERFQTGLDVMGDVTGTPAQTMSQSEPSVSDKVASLLKAIPSMKGALSQVLTTGGSLVKYGLTVPGLLLKNSGNIVRGVGSELKNNLGEAALQAIIDQAKKIIVNEAPGSIQEAVSSVLDSSGITGANPGPIVGDRMAMAGY